ncbi:hypothetical protein A3765_10635 [Oleiphilus sp. HI0130]|nr:hypothetical protein A3765_25395 [Oleiphilus sp. HI0130]KZZ75269.1 hypothetical protein A3765_10635 [Oleiphilus sp. HI0130]
MNVTGEGGKGSARRKEDKSAFDRNFDRIFGKKKSPVAVGHGQRFGFGNWYTFHCPSCEAQINKVDNPTECRCGQGLKWGEE